MEFNKISDRIFPQCAQIQNHLAFLKFYDENPEYYFDNSVKRSIHRYESFWIPFIQNNSNNTDEDLQFSPPLDVHWAWHVHMLAPHAYKADLESSPLKRIIGHKPFDPSSEQEKSKRSKTALLWQKWFPNEPFDIEQSNAEFLDFTTSLSYDIVQASRRQQVFFY